MEDRLALPCSSNPIRRRIYLTFPLQADVTEIQHFIIGSIALETEKDSSSISFALKQQNNDEKNNVQPNYFSLEPMAGTLSQGQNTNVSVRFTPPQLAEKETSSSNFSVGQWSQMIYECTLSGGYTTPGTKTKENIVDIVLRGYVYIY